MMQTMQYRDYIFRCNPKSITVLCGSRVVSHFCPGRGELCQDMGGNSRTVRCEGVFFGGSFEEALAQAEHLQQRMGDGEAGILLIPGLRPFMAHLREFQFDAQGDGRIIPYRITFIEAEGMR